MLRITRLAIILICLIALWLKALSTSTTPDNHTILLLTPLLAVVAFGLYLLCSLFYGIAVFKTVPSEAEALQRDIARARKDLTRRGIAH